jgi:adenylate cyclase
MADERAQRRLAAILAADVVGYSRLMQIDESGTLAGLKKRRTEVLRPAVESHRGRIVKFMGDGVLIEFPSAVDAVECAVGLQQGMEGANVGLPAERRIVLRIGINLGDVMVEGSDIYGDGVNIAARLEALAEPGGVLLSQTVFDHVRGKVSIGFLDLGPQSLKNMAEPVRAFKVSGLAGEAGAAAPRPAEASPKTSIAVLPFDNMSGDPEQEYFADGMVEDIITALSRFEQLFVIARNSCFTYKGKAVDVRQVSKDLGVRFLLEGSVRKAGNRLRITGQLIDATSGSHLWAEKFDGGLEDVFELQDRITEKVVGAIEPTLRKVEIERVRRKPVENLDAYDLYLRALPHVYAFRPDENLVALTLLTKAIELDPNYAAALGHAAWCYEQRVVRGWEPVGADDAQTAIALAHRALAAGADDAIALATGGFTLLMVGRDYDNGLDALRRALARNPGSGFIAFLAATALAMAGNPQESLAQAERAMALSPLDPAYFLYLTIAALAHLYSGRPAEALELARRSAALYADWDSTYWVLVPAYVQLDRMPEARAALAKLQSLAPGFTISVARQRLPIRDPASLEMVLAGFQKAGLPA